MNMPRYHAPIYFFAWQLWVLSLVGVLWLPAQSLSRTNQFTHLCDRLVGDPVDPQNKGATAFIRDDDAEHALKVCSEAIDEFPDEPRFKYLLGRALDQAGNHKQAFTLYSRALNSNYPIAYLRIGEFYLFGKSVPKSEVRAWELFEKAEELGVYEAKTAKAVLLISRKPSDQKSYSHARDLFFQAAEAGSSLASEYLGLMYQQGLGVPKNTVKAAQWFKKAALAGNPIGMVGYGNIVISGDLEGTEVMVGFRWLEKAASLGDETAMYVVALECMKKKFCDDENKSFNYLYKIKDRKNIYSEVFKYYFGFQIK